MKSQLSQVELYLNVRSSNEWALSSSTSLYKQKAVTEHMSPYTGIMCMSIVMYILSGSSRRERVRFTSFIKTLHGLYGIKSCEQLVRVARPFHYEGTFCTLIHSSHALPFFFMNIFSYIRE